MRHLLYPIQSTDIIECVNGWRKTTVQTENLILNESGEGEEVEEIGEVFPDICVTILAQALVVKAVNLCDLARLVIATKDGDALWVADLEADEEGHSFDTVVAAVDIVA